MKYLFSTLAALALTLGFSTAAQAGPKLPVGLPGNVIDSQGNFNTNIILNINLPNIVLPQIPGLGAQGNGFPGQQNNFRNQFQNGQQNGRPQQNFQAQRFGR